MGLGLRVTATAERHLSLDDARRSDMVEGSVWSLLLAVYVVGLVHAPQPNVLPGCAPDTTLKG